MKVQEMAQLPPGTKLMYERRPFRDSEEVEFIGPYTESLGKGAYAERALVRLADGREGIVAAGHIRLVDDYALSPSMEKALRNAARDNYAGIFECTRQTEDALVLRGLARLVYGSAEVSSYRHTGVYGRTTTIYDARLGIEFTDLGREVAARLIEGGGP